MSFGYSAGEIVGLTQLAWKIVQNTRKACGEHNSLTHEVSNLHGILLRLEHSASVENPALNSHNDIGTQALRHSVDSLRTALRELDEILQKYAALSESQRTTTRLWGKIRFGNGPMLDLGNIRMKIMTSMAVITAHLNMGMSEDIRKMEGSLKTIAGRMAEGGEGTVLTSYEGDDRSAWRELRRELRNEGFEDSFVRERKASIIEFITELGKRGLLDVDQSNIDGPSAAHNMVHEVSSPYSNPAVPSEQDLDNPFERDSVRDTDEDEDDHGSRSSSSDIGDNYSADEDDTQSVDSEPSAKWPESIEATQDSTIDKSPNDRYRHCFNCGVRELRSSPPNLFKKISRCKHTWCARCIHQAFVSSLIDPSDMPPSCCNICKVPRHVATMLFDTKFKHLWNRRYFEQTVENPAFCPNLRCGELIYPKDWVGIHPDGWIHSSLRKISGPAPCPRPRLTTFPYTDVKKVWKCNKCKQKMCVRCNTSNHSSEFGCVDEAIRARNARRSSSASAARDAASIAKVISSNPYNEKLAGKRRIRMRDWVSR